MQIRRCEFQPYLLARFTARASVRRFAVVRVQLAAARTPQAEVRLLRAFEQQHVVLLAKAVKQRGNFVGQRHPGSEAAGNGAGKAGSQEMRTRSVQKARSGRRAKPLRPLL